MRNRSGPKRSKRRSNSRKSAPAGRRVPRAARLPKRRNTRCSNPSPRRRRPIPHPFPKPKRMKSSSPMEKQRVSVRITDTMPAAGKTGRDGASSRRAASTAARTATNLPKSRRNPCSFPKPAPPPAFWRSWKVTAFCAWKTMMRVPTTYTSRMRRSGAAI